MALLTTPYFSIYNKTMLQVNEIELYDACRVLFGNEARVDRQFLEYIQTSGLKSAYRKIALATHPDRYVSMGEEYQKKCSESFIAATEAYEKISKYLKLREDGFKFAAVLGNNAGNNMKTHNASYSSGYSHSYGDSAWQKPHNGKTNSGNGYGGNGYGSNTYNNSGFGHNSNGKSPYGRQSDGRQSTGSRAYNTNKTYSGGAFNSRTDNSSRQGSYSKSSFAGSGKSASANASGTTSGTTSGRGFYDSKRFYKKDDYFTINSKAAGAYSYQSKSLPGRKLRIGEFLYYSGLVSWRDLIAAILWQSRQRHRMGEIAIRWGWLTEERVMEIIRNKHRGERLGEYLVRYNIITPFQCSMLLWQQQKAQRPLGEYFVKERLLTESDLNRYLRHLRDHNVKQAR
ncbi:MAG: hypothetical protein HQK89_09850 [Nitrospirae bacterium]|nr:hypothetical protein [Nitrospirota bacterium]